MKNIIFSETQRFRQKWISLLLMLLIMLFVYGIIRQTIFDIPFGDNPAPSWLLGIFLLIPTSLFIVFQNSMLQVEVSEADITFLFRPFHKRAKKIHWSEIEKIYVRQYKPIREYGGWGLRMGSKGKAYTTQGNMGLQIELKTGKQILLGTQKSTELKSILETHSLYKA